MEKVYESRTNEDTTQEEVVEPPEEAVAEQEVSARSNRYS
jgi:hypothetical protein